MSSEKNIFCSECGSGNPDTAKFCRECGFNLEKRKALPLKSSLLVQNSEEETGEGSDVFISYECLSCNALNPSTNEYCFHCGIYGFYEQLLCSKCRDIVKEEETTCDSCNLQFSKRDTSELGILEFDREEKDRFMVEIINAIQRSGYSLDSSFYEGRMRNSLNHYTTIKLLMSPECPQKLLDKYTTLPTKKQASLKADSAAVEKLQKISELYTKTLALAPLALKYWENSVSLVAYFWYFLNDEKSPSKEQEMVSSNLIQYLKNSDKLVEYLFAIASTDKQTYIVAQEKRLNDHLLLNLLPKYQKEGMPLAIVINSLGTIGNTIDSDFGSKEKNKLDDYYKSKSLKYFEAAVILTACTTNFMWKNKMVKLIPLVMNNQINQTQEKGEKISVRTRMQINEKLLKAAIDSTKKSPKILDEDSIKTILYCIGFLYAKSNYQEIKKEGQKVLKLIDELFEETISKRIKIFIGDFNAISIGLAYIYDNKVSLYTDRILVLAKTLKDSEDRNNLIYNATEGLGFFFRQTRQIWSQEAAVILIKKLDKEFVAKIAEEERKDQREKMNR